MGAWGFTPWGDGDIRGSQGHGGCRKRGEGIGWACRGKGGGFGSGIRDEGAVSPEGEGMKGLCGG